MKIWLPQKFIIISNLTFLMPLITAIISKYYFWSILISGVIILSLFYHFSPKGNRLFYRLDHTFAWLLILTNLIMVLSSKFYGNPYFYLTIMCVVVALYFYFNHTKSYKYHDYWHIFSSLITLFSILTTLK